MKATSIPNAILTLVVAVFATIQVNSAVAAANKKMDAVKYHNAWIPACTLDAVEITADKPAAELVETAEYRGEMIPAISLPVVTIRANGSYTPEDVQPVTVETVRPAGHRVAAVRVNGEYIPSMVMAPVTISAADQVSDEVTVADNPSPNVSAQPVFNISARKTFDVLVNLVVDKVLNIVHQIIGSGK